MIFSIYKYVQLINYCKRRFLYTRDQFYFRDHT